MALGGGGPRTNGREGARSQKGRKPGENIRGKQIDFGGGGAAEIAKNVSRLVFTL